MIGIIGAMPIEVEKLKAVMTEVEVIKCSQKEYYKGVLWGKDVVVAVAGVGKVNAAVCTQTMILRFDPSFIINTGVAGGLKGAVNIGDVVIGKNLVQHDMDTTPVGDPLGFVSGKGMDRVYFPCDEALSLKLQNAIVKVEKVKSHVGNIATGDQFLCDSDKISTIGKTFDAIAFDMESASVGQVCFVNEVPCGIIRAISDAGDEQSAMDFPTFVAMASDNAIEILKAFLELS